MKRFAMLNISCVLMSACLLAGCAPPRDIAEDFQDKDPKIRIGAIRRAGREKLASAAPYLVDRLSDCEAEVRVFAIASLREITGETLGYRHYDPPPLRREAIERWRKWLVDNKVELPETQPGQERKTG